MLRRMLRTQVRLRMLSLSLLLGVCVLAHTSMAQGKQEDYDVKIVTPYSTSLGEDQEIVVKVRTLQGMPAHGIPVRFHLAPAWQGKAQIVPTATTTAHGIARARVRADLLGRVGVTVQVGFGTVTKRTGVLFHDDSGETGDN